jgi:hypothetical protein
MKFKIKNFVDVDIPCPYALEEKAIDACLNSKTREIGKDIKIDDDKIYNDLPF